VRSGRSHYFFILIQPELRLSPSQTTQNLLEYRIVSEEFLVHRIPTTYLGDRKLLTVIAVLKKVRYALCPMPYALCPMPYAR
jgi:hypothetical protein